VTYTIGPELDYAFEFHFPANGPQGGLLCLCLVDAPNLVYVSGQIPWERNVPLEDRYFRVPPEARAAARALRDPTPLLDYLIERNPDLTWLQDAVHRIFAVK
jgi:hypothetical protein